MRIKINNRTTSELSPGDCFLYDKGSGYDEVFLVVSSQLDDVNSNEDFPVLAVSLTSNYLTRFREDSKVKKVDAEVVINKD